MKITFPTDEGIRVNGVQAEMGEAKFISDNEIELRYLGVVKVFERAGEK